MTEERNPKVTLIGLATLLWGGTHFVLGAVGGLLDHWTVGPGLGLSPLRWIAGDSLDSNVETAFVVQGILALFAGGAILLRLQWGRILALLLAGMAILWAIEALNDFLFEDFSWIVILLPFAGVQIAYAVLTLVILIRHRGDFPDLAEGDTATNRRSMPAWAAWVSPAVGSILCLALWIWMRNHQSVRGERPPAVAVFCLIVAAGSLVGGAAAVFGLFGIRSSRSALNIVPGSLLGLCINGINLSWTLVAYLFEGAAF